MASMMRVLMVGYDRPTFDRWSDGLRRLGMRAESVADVEAAMAALEAQRRDAVVLGPAVADEGAARIGRAMPPQACGGTPPPLLLSAAEAAAACGPDCPGQACSRRARPVDRCALATLLHARRLQAAGQPDQVLQVGKLRLDPAARSVHVDDLAVALTPREFGLLHALMRDARGLITREQVHDLMDGAGPSSVDAVGVHIHHLRRKIGADLIRTVRGVGYKLVADSTRW
jgi:two-component system OmpR family response regulator/two-component system response regulator QseB